MGAVSIETRQAMEVFKKTIEKVFITTKVQQLNCDFFAPPVPGRWLQKNTPLQPEHKSFLTVCLSILHPSIRLGCRPGTRWFSRGCAVARLRGLVFSLTFCQSKFIYFLTSNPRHQE